MSGTQIVTGFSPAAFIFSRCLRTRFAPSLMVLVEMLPGRHHGLVEPAQRRAAIARDVARGVEPGRHVTLALHDREARQRLHAVEVNPALVCGVFVVQRDGRQARSLRHFCFSQSGRQPVSPTFPQPVIP